ncbi:hypothetical protein [Bacillus thuringiensis]|uniref:hypothetical protein n=1 Tax=Bacillus thuringiensis TaxID=1428 RepID=UPI001145D89D|nr:hypothetical protein [Bacillus thuringiensis]
MKRKQVLILSIFQKEKMDRMLEEFTDNDRLLITLAGPLTKMVLGTLTFIIKYFYFIDYYIGYFAHEAGHTIVARIKG